MKTPDVIRAGLAALVVAGAGAGMAAAADADAPTAFKVAFSPNTTATGTAVTATLAGPDLDAAEAGKQVVSLKLQAPAGLKVDRKGVKAVCTAAEAAMKACPATSKGGSGTATFTAAGVGDVTAPITLYVTDPVQAGDPAGIQLLASALGQTFALVARVVPGASGPALVADGIDKALPLPITIKSLALTFAGKNVVQKTVIKKVKVRKTVNGRKRTVIVKKKVKVNVTLPLLTTPKTCPATGWAAAATVGFKDGSSFVAPATAPCVTK